jgi:hypothetical protein
VALVALYGSVLALLLAEDKVKRFCDNCGREL